LPSPWRHSSKTTTTTPTRSQTPQNHEKIRY
jgi:hypothetical protein